MMVLLYRGTDVHCAEHGEDIGLKKGDQQFKCGHEDREHKGERRYRQTYSWTVLSEDENQAEEGKCDDVSRRYIGEKTNHQYEGAQENTKDFNGCQQKEDGLWNAGHHEHVFPVILVRTEGNDYEREERQCHRNADVARKIGSTWKHRNKSQQVSDPDEEENREQIRKELLVFMPDAGFDHLVTHKKYDRFDGVLETCRS